MAELADAPDLGSGVHRRAGSSPVIRTLRKPCKRKVLYGQGSIHDGAEKSAPSCVSARLIQIFFRSF